MRRESDIRAGTSWPHPGRITNMATRDVDEPGIAPCRPDAECVADRPDANPCKPEPETQDDRARQRAVEDRHRARRTPEQERPAERAMDSPEEHTSALQSLVSTYSAVVRLKTKTQDKQHTH